MRGSCVATKPSLTLRTMAEDNRSGSLCGKCVYFRKLLTTVCILVVCQASAQIHTPIDFRDVLKSEVFTIQNDINQFCFNEYDTLFCHHYPVHDDDFTKIVIFIWASERETHAMRTCLYQQLKREGECMARELHYKTSSSPTVDSVFETTFCNRTVHVVIMTKILNETEVIGLSLFLNDLENDGLIVEKTNIWYNDSGIPTVTSAIAVRPLRNDVNHRQTFVCNSLRLSSKKTGKLRQRFFSFVGNSTEVVVKSTLGSSANMSLGFDVMALNTSRLGLLNDSNIEFLFLTQLGVDCDKRDQYGLNKETNEITYIDTMEELVVTTKAIIIDDKLRIRVNVSIPVVSDHNFGQYFCKTYCEFQTKNRNETIKGCFQVKFFSIVSHDWREENLFFKQDIHKCKKDITILSAENANLHCIVQNLENRQILVKEFLQLGKLVANEVLDYVKNPNVFVKFTAIFVIISLLTSLKLYTSATVKKHADKRVMKYDVFLSNSSKDQQWVESTLLNFIESKGFKVCYGERDFPFGCNLVDTIARAVYESRKVIAVVSPNYLESGWCTECEFVLTYTKIIHKEAPCNSLLLIKYKQCQMPESMNCFKYLDYTRTRDNPNILMKILSYVFRSHRKVDTGETPKEKQFFHDLLKWLGKPHIGKQCSVNKSWVARRKRHGRRK